MVVSAICGNAPISRAIKADMVWLFPSSLGMGHSTTIITPWFTHGPCQGKNDSATSFFAPGRINLEICRSSVSPRPGGSLHVHDSAMVSSQVETYRVVP